MVTWVFQRLVDWAKDRPKGSIPFSYVIEDYIDNEPYLTRTLFWRVFGFRPMLHHFHRGDGDRALHNHPWKWSFSLILKGSYTEERLGKGYRRIRWFNLIRDNDFHRVSELHGDVWTLFCAGPKTQGWGFMENGQVTPHEEYIARKRKEEGYK